eukprot:1131108-Amphidinium_carterae.1
MLFSGATIALCSATLRSVRPSSNKQSSYGLKNGPFFPNHTLLCNLRWVEEILKSNTPHLVL